MPVETLLQVTYRIDGRNRITSVGHDWDTFALENGASDLQAEAVVGRSLEEFISGPETAHLWDGLLGVVRGGRSIVGLPYRCDSPSVRRFLEMTLTPLPASAVEFRSRVVREETRSPLGLLDPAAPRTPEFVKLCSWCRRLQRDRYRWDELEVACRDLGLLERRALPQISHSICLDCFGRAADEI